MSMLVNPTTLTLLNTQMSNTAVIFRNFSRLLSEKVGLPQAVPNDRKMDYFFRDVIPSTLNIFIIELSYRVANTIVLMPVLRKCLELDKRPHQKNYTPLLEKYFLDSSFKTDSMVLVPRLFDAEKSPEANHLATQLRKSTEPAVYLKTHQAKLGLAKADPQRIMTYLKQQDSIAELFKQAQKPLSYSEALESLAKHPQAKTSKVIQSLLALPSKDFEKLFKGLTWRDNLQWIGEKILLQTHGRMHRLKQLANVHEMQQAREAFPKALTALQTHLQALADNPILSKKPMLKSLAPMPLEELQEVVREESILGVPMRLVKRLWGHHRIHKTQQSFLSTIKLHWAELIKDVHGSRKYGAPHHLYPRICEEIIVPLALQQDSKLSNQKSVVVLRDLCLQKANLMRIIQTIQRNSFWVRLPFSVVCIFLAFGIGTNLFEAKVIQPYQRKIVQLRGDATEFLKPGMAGVFAGFASYIGLIHLPIIKRMGYISRVAIAGTLSTAAYLATMYGLFQYVLSKPRKNKPQATVSKPITLRPSNSTTVGNPFQMQTRFNTLASWQGQPFTPTPSVWPQPTHGQIQSAYMPR